MQMLRFSATAGDCFNINVMIAYNATPMTTECINMVKPRSAIGSMFHKCGYVLLRENNI